MKGFRRFFDELVHADSITEVLLENRKETVKLAAILVVILLGLLLYLHQQDAALDVSDAAQGEDTQVTRLDGFGESAGGSVDNGTADPSSGAAGSGGAGNAGGESGAGDAGVAGGLPMDTDGIVYVDIGGAVKHPMLAELPAGSRVEDAIKAAGGLKKDADMSEVNRAAVLTDGEKVYIPAEGEEPGMAGSGLAAAEGSSGSSDAGSAGSGMVGVSGGRININTADAVLLQQLTGVGPVTAQKIIDYREQNGRFNSIEELKEISGIGEKTFEKMRDDVTI